MSEIRIEVREVDVFGFGSSYGHLYLVFRDDSGNEFVIRGGPASDIPPSGSIVTEVNVPIALSEDIRTENGEPDGEPVTPAERGSRVIPLDGRAAEDVWAIMLQQAANIQGAALSYQTFARNSNSTVASVLNVVGIDVFDVLPSIPDVDSTPGKDNLLDFDHHLAGTEGNDIMRGAGGDDTFFGSEGNDKIFGSPVRGGSEPDGMDTVDYSDSTSGIVADLVAGRVQDGLGGVDTIESIERIVGSNFNDVFFPATAFDTEFEGGEGEDTIDYSGIQSRVEVDLVAGTGLSVRPGTF